MTEWIDRCHFGDCRELMPQLPAGIADANMHTDLTVGDVVFVGEVAPIPTKHLCDADDVIDLMGERAYDEVGEYADGYPDVPSEAKAELDALLAGWIEKHAKPTFYSVINVREHVITAADMEGREK